MTRKYSLPEQLKAKINIQLMKGENLLSLVKTEKPETILEVRRFLEELIIYTSNLKRTDGLTLKKLRNLLEPVIQYYEKNSCNETLESCITDSCFDGNPDCFKRKLFGQIEKLQQISHPYLLKEKEKNVSEGITKTILVVEDDLHQQKLLNFKLVKDGYKVIPAKTGIDAFKVLEQQEVDMIVCDIMMPGMDGFVFLQKLKKNVNYQKIPFLFLTAVSDEQSTLKGLELGADDYLKKPFSPAELSMRIKKLLKLKTV